MSQDEPTDSINDVGNSKDPNYESDYPVDSGGEDWFGDPNDLDSVIEVISLDREGGGASVFAKQTGDSWKFSCVSSDLDPDTETRQHYCSDPVPVLEAALPEWWAHAYPHQIHHLFKEWFQLHYEHLAKNNIDGVGNTYNRSKWMKVLYETMDTPFIKPDNSPIKRNLESTMTKARSINIFLLDGNTDGVRMAQITMSTIQAIAFRRPQFSRVKQEFKEITRPGVYILLGTNPNDPDSKLAYIGESEDVAARLQFHNTNEKTKDKFDFWTDTIALISKDENLTKSHARYVEARFIAAASENKRWTLLNGQKPSEIGKLPRPDQEAMDEFIAQSKMLVGTLGWDLFKSITTHPLDAQNLPEVSDAEPSVSPEFYFSGSTYSATAVVSQTTGEWIIKKNSRARLTTANAVPKGALKMRDQLQADGILIVENDNLVFAQDCKFTSPSMAAQVICGFSVSGRTAWKTSSGQTYADWDAEQVATTSPVTSG